MRKRANSRLTARILAYVMALAVMVTSLPATMLVHAEEGAADAGPANIAPQATATATVDRPGDGGGVAALNNEVEPKASLNSQENAINLKDAWHTWTCEGQEVFAQYTWEKTAEISSAQIYYFADGGGILIPAKVKFEYFDEAAKEWKEAKTEELTTDASKYGEYMDKFNVTEFETPIVTSQLKVTLTPQEPSPGLHAVGIREWKVMGTLKEKELPNIALEASPSGSIDSVGDGGGLKTLNNGVEPKASHIQDENSIVSKDVWHTWGLEGKEVYAQYTWDRIAEIKNSQLYYFRDGGGILIPAKVKYEYFDMEAKEWKEAKTEELDTANDAAYLNKFNVTEFETPIVTNQLKITLTPQGFGTPENHAVGIREWKVLGELKDPVAGEDGVTVTQTANGYRLSNDYFIVETGTYGNIHSLQIKGDQFPTNYVMNPSNAAAQASAAGHQWLGELMFKVKSGDSDWSEQNTGRSASGRNVTLDGSKVVVTYENATEEKGIKDFKLVETYSLEPNGKLRWEITVTNTKDSDLVIGDFGLPLAFNEYWPGGEEIYETRTVDHSFVGKDSSYLYVTRPSGLGKFLVMTPDVSTGAGFEYQDHWRAAERAEDERSWCQDESGWANGLNVFYIHSDVIKSTNRGYLDNTSLTLKAGESKTYAFNFTAAEDEDHMKSILYNEGIIDATAVPGMAYSVNMPGKMYLHTGLSKDDISFSIQCPHENGLHEGNPKTVSNHLECKKNDANTYVKYLETKEDGGEQYHIYELKFADLGQNNVVVNYTTDGVQKQTVLQFYMMDNVADALETHSDFMVEKTQINTPGQTGDKVFDDWMMDDKKVRAEIEPKYWEMSYWGWGDDWGLTHGEYIAEKNVYQPVAKEIEAVDQYLDVAIWNGLMREHQTDYKIHDFLMVAPNASPDGRGYAYPHIYNTYFSMYKIAKKYPDTVEYIEETDTYLLRAYRILNALYGNGVGYNWATGLMGELTTPAIIAALREEGYYEEADNVVSIMARKYNNFKNTKYPYGSEYSYDNTGEEAVYTLAKVNLGNDTANASTMMSKINSKTRACRGVQPIWYHYANPTTICGENWWNFQYTAALAGYTMDDWLRLQENGMTAEERAKASRVNYAAKLANLTCINSGQIDADPENIGTVSWTYQSEMGNLGGQGTGSGNLHNGWRQMAGEADLGLFGALQILSADVTVDPIFGLFGYGCEVSEANGKYTVTPLDGLFTKLNFINNKLYIELERDQYTRAVVGTDNTSVELSMKNIEGTAHDTEIDFTGLKAGAYEILVNNKAAGTFQAVDGQTSTITVSLPKAGTATVKVVSGTAGANQKPVVNAGADQTVGISDSVRLVGTATDDGYVNAVLSYQWEVVSAPEGGEATIANADKRISNVTFSKVGSYVLKLTANDGELSESDTVTYTVTEDAAKPEVIAAYDFESISADKKYVMTTGGKEYYGVLTYNPQLVDGKSGKGLKMTGKIGGGYLELPHTLTDLVSNATVSMDVYLNANQANHTTIFRFGEAVVVELVNGNELSMTVNGNTKNTGITLAPQYWKNIALTANGGDYALYVDGVKRAELKDTGLIMKDIQQSARYLVGRNIAESGAFLNAVVDNFAFRSKALTDAEMKDTFGSSETAEIISAKEPTVVTPVGTAPELPEMVSALYSNGVYELRKVVWEAVDEDSYKEAGQFVVGGTIEGTDVTATVRVIVVAGKLQNIASAANATAIINSVQDLGGVAGLNDGNDPANSRDTSHGAWHNWLGNQGGSAWIRYDWNEEQMISKMDIYFFRDGSGNFAPANYIIEYLGDDDSWHDVEGVQGLGVELDQYNTTTFDPVFTTAIRVTMNPATLGCGVLEWKVYAYQEGDPIDRTALKSAITAAEGLKQSLFTAGMEAVQAALETARAVEGNQKATQGEIDLAAKKLSLALLELTPDVENNIAYVANVSTSFVSTWETLGAVNDGVALKNAETQKHYGSWGNESASESLIYTWGLPVTLTSSDIYFWNDGGGIMDPASYLYEYLDENGEWKPVANPDGYKIYDDRGDGEEPHMDGFNTTTFDAVTTTAFRVTIEKQVADGNGIGLIEWRVSGAVKEGTSEMIEADEALIQAIGLVPEKEPEEYTADSYKVYSEALAAAKLLQSDPDATAEQKKAAAKALEDAYKALSLKPVDPKPDPEMEAANKALKDAIALKPEKPESDYTEASYKAYTDALAEAKRLQSDAAATAAQKKAAAAALQEAYKALKLKDIPQPSVKDLVLNQTSLSIYQGLQAKITVKQAPEGAITWKTSAPKVATVSNGTVKAVGKGTATITASVAGKSATCKVTVKKLATVTGVKASCAGSESVKISWKKVTGAKQYQVYRKSGKTWKKIATVKGLSYTNKKLSNNKTYQYRVRAMLTSGALNSYGDYSKVVKGTTGPKKVSGLKLKKVSKTSYKISWKKVSKATSYEIYKKTGNGAYKKVKTVNAKTLKYTVKGLKKGKSYRFYVRAIRKSGKSKYKGTPAYTKTIKIKK
ncbi:DUF5695 domain-containing protein [Lachnospiraceae bacterium 29-84]